MQCLISKSNLVNMGNGFNHAKNTLKPHWQESYEVQIIRWWWYVRIIVQNDSFVDLQEKLIQALKVQIKT